MLLFMADNTQAKTVVSSEERRGAVKDMIFYHYPHNGKLHGDTQQRL